MSAPNAVKITECPRDAMQGIKAFIPTEDKVRYMNALLKVGFDTLDFGSFVSPKAVPQMRDTKEVLKKMDLSHSYSKLLAIVGNLRGAEEACQHEAIYYIGFPFSFSPTFLERNINSTVDKSFNMLKELLDLCRQNNKHLRVYISMAFGNPYGDEWNTELLLHWIDQLHWAGVRHIALADTTGMGNASTITEAFQTIIPNFAEVKFGLHLHTTSVDWYEKIDAAYQNGCRHFDGVLNGLGGCPMAGPELVGNIKTADLHSYFEEHRAQTGIDQEAFQRAQHIANQIMPVQG
ncbi:hydroxymethylglutaryl-CoA lyase [Catalinimonas alkaloidigena]|uniref:hydroxymethylglutaryl-CoA lyase n=1 Tax=Catalinimonas alkaloidigena TaxID=1075417 RepID=UPI002405C744|nr:hydroxymethylglutaryl-CoA lyase [Catalinimonas alkaloidigena]MDF9796807.1 hydroxymethylglutaryl-CoA lyase [Catalinimonas alkaloidigena]